MLLATFPGPELRIRALAHRRREAQVLVAGASMVASRLTREMRELSLHARWDLEAFVARGWQIVPASEEALVAGLVGAEALEPEQEPALLAETPAGQLVLVTASLLVMAAEDPDEVKAGLENLEGLEAIAELEPGLITARLSARSFAELHQHLAAGSALVARLQDHDLVDTVDVEVLERLAWRGNGVLGLAAECVAAPAQPPRFEEFDWHWQRCRCLEPWRRGVLGKGVAVGVIDGGFASTHPDLAPDHRSSWLDRSGRRRSIGSPHTIDLPNRGMPCEEHGTQCAGLVAALHNGFGVRGAAPDCGLLLSALNDVTSQVQLARALLWLGRQGVQVVSCSLGVEHPRWWLMARVLDVILGRVAKSAVLCWAVANEEGRHVSDDFIASREDVLAVGAIDAACQRPGGAVGPELDLVAPGWATWTTTTRHPGYEQVLGGGSSLATPIVAGIAALLRSALQMKPQEAADLLRASAAAIGSKPNDVFGYGCVDAEETMRLALGP